MSDRHHEDPERRARRRALRRVVPSKVPCAVPGCRYGRVTDDCCYEHSLDGPGEGGFLPNDGVIDWLAIDVCVQGLRVVRLSSVEFEIAGGYMLAKGYSQELIRDRLGMKSRTGGSRLKKMEAIADAIRCAA